jgi:hypothetical protein
MIKNPLSTVEKFRARKILFATYGLLPMFLLIVLGCVFLILALFRRNEWYALLGNVFIFVSGIVYVFAAKRYYRCPACEKVVVPLGDDGKPSEVSFAIAYRPECCPYCAAVSK